MAESRHGGKKAWLFWAATFDNINELVIWVMPGMAALIVRRGWIKPLGITAGRVRVFPFGIWAVAGCAVFHINLPTCGYLSRD